MRAALLWLAVGLVWTLYMVLKSGRAWADFATTSNVAYVIGLGTPFFVVAIVLACLALRRRKTGS